MSKYKFKITVIGDGFVGKTSLISKFTQGNFQEDYIQTIGAQFSEYVKDLVGKSTYMDQTSGAINYSINNLVSRSIKIRRKYKELESTILRINNYITVYTNLQADLSTLTSRLT